MRFGKHINGVSTQKEACIMCWNINLYDAPLAITLYHPISQAASIKAKLGTKKEKKKKKNRFGCVMCGSFIGRLLKKWQ